MVSKYLNLQNEIMKKIFAALLMLISINGYSQTADFILGHWKMKGKDIIVLIKKENNKYVGYIVDSNDKTKDNKRIIWDLSFNNSLKEWTEGNLQLSEMDHTAHCYITYKSPNEISITGYHGFKLFSKTVTATKINN